MSKIIISFATLAQGGAARVCANLAKPLCDVFDEVFLVTWADKPQFYNYDLRARWYCIPQEAGGANEIKRMRWFRRFVKQEKPDLILSFLEPFNIRVLLCTLGLGIKTIVAERTDPWIVNKYLWMQAIEKLIYRRADGILVQTPSIKRYFNGPLLDRTHIIYNPVNLPAEMVGKALNVPKKKRIVFVGRLMPVKKLDVLIRAFDIFIKRHPGYTLTLYGEGPLLGDLNDMVGALHLEESVFLPGPSTTIHQDILDSEMMCLVSEREGMSNAMIEAMTLGLPCICSKVSGAIDLIVDGRNGLLVDVGDVNGLAEKMEFVSNNPQIAEKIGKESIKIYEQLNKDKVNQEWIDYIKAMIDK